MKKYRNAIRFQPNIHMYELPQAVVLRKVNWHINGAKDLLLVLDLFQL